MRGAAWLALSGCLGASVPAEPSSLQALRWRVVADSLQVDFEFAHGRPERYRIQASQDTAREKALVVEFSGARISDPERLNPPGWAHVIAVPDTGILAIRIQLDEATPWKASWEGNILRMDIMNRVRSGGVWRNPWMIGGVAGAAIAGGVVWWLSGMARGRSSSGDGAIPPPDVVFPR